ncbi:hypothetical protein ACFWNE_06740 [Streptomyces goshikiensis]|uniref:hypothetical protein n=1 Tax=Streptomyces goshikiensis TaxID=1942 RepID=UPI003653E011
MTIETTWDPRELADAAKMNARIRDPARTLSNPIRISGAGLSKISSIPGDGSYRTLKWDTSETFGAWTVSADEAFTTPQSGTYFVTADVTALVPANPTALRLVCISTSSTGAEREWLRSYNNTLIPRTYLTCSLRGLVYLAKGDRLSFRANTPPNTNPWEISSPARPSGQMNNFSAICIAPEATSL